MTDPVAPPGSHHQEPAERHGVAGDDPGGGDRPAAQLADDPWQGGDHHRPAHDVDELHRAQHRDGRRRRRTTSPGVAGKTPHTGNLTASAAIRNR